MNAPRHIPVFCELLERDDVLLLDAVIYGALAHFEAVGITPRARDVAAAVGRTVPDVRRVIPRLERIGLIRREYKARGAGVGAAYTLLGPKVAPADIADRNVA